MDREKRVRGALLLGRLRYVRKLGLATEERVLDAMPPRERALLQERKLQPTEWYAAEILERLDSAIATEAAAGNREAALIALGQSSADASFGPTGALRSHAGSHDPHALLREVPRVHAGLQGAGPQGYARVSGHAALVRAVKGERNGGRDCLTNVGWLQRALELCGARDVHVVETACIGRGGNRCEFRCEWR